MCVLAALGATGKQFIGLELDCKAQRKYEATGRKVLSYVCMRLSTLFGNQFSKHKQKPRFDASIHDCFLRCSHHSSKA